MLIDKNNSDLYSIKELELYGRRLAKIQGEMGLNYAPTNYYLIDDNVPQLFLRTEGITKELDLDRMELKKLLHQFPELHHL